MLVLVFAACNPNASPAPTTAESFEATAPTTLDVLFVVDNSVSMKQEQAALAKVTEMDFAGWFNGDTHVGAATTDNALIHWIPGDCDEDCRAAWLPNLEPGTDGSDKEAGIGIGLSALSAPLSETDNVDFLHVGALHSFIFVSDENDCTGLETDPLAFGEECYTRYDELTPLDDLLQAALDLDPDGRVQMSGIVGPSAISDCAYAVPGTRYHEAIERLGGVNVSICHADDADGLAAIQTKQLATADQFRLATAANPDSVEVTVDDVEVPEGEANGWTYDEPLKLLTLHGTSAPSEGATVQIAYAPAS